MSAARGWPLVAAAGLLAVAALAAAGGAATPVGNLSTGGILRVERFDPCPAAPNVQQSPAAGTATQDQPARECTGQQRGAFATSGPERYVLLKTVFTGILIAVVVAGFATTAVLLITFLTAARSIRVCRRRDAPAAAPDDSLGDARPEQASARLDAAAQAGLADLSDETDPRRAVIAAWLRLEAAAAAGTVRRPAETPGELAERVLAEHAVSPVTLRRLVDLYREARYSSHEVDEHMRADARRALERLRRELTAAVSL